MEYFKKKYYFYDLEYYFEPGKWMDKAGLTALLEQLEIAKRLSGKQFSYGFFDKSVSLEERLQIFNVANLCIIKECGNPVGFFYNIVIREGKDGKKPIIHAGLVVVAKNAGVDLIGYPYSFMTCLQFKKYGHHFYTNISSTPSIVGVFSDSFTGVWPSYKGNQIKPPSKEYLGVLDLLNENYIKKYFKDYAYEVDKKRFVLRSASNSMGFETDLKKLARYSKAEVNNFCMFWLDYSKGEDLIQVGWVDWKAVAKIKAFYSFQKMKSLFKVSKLKKIHLVHDRGSATREQVTGQVQPQDSTHLQVHTQRRSHGSIAR